MPFFLVRTPQRPFSMLTAKGNLEHSPGVEVCIFYACTNALGVELGLASWSRYREGASQKIATERPFFCLARSIQTVNVISDAPLFTARLCSETHFEDSWKASSVIINEFRDILKKLQSVFYCYSTRGLNTSLFSSLEWSNICGKHTNTAFPHFDVRCANVPGNFNLCSSFLLFYFFLFISYA